MAEKCDKPDTISRRYFFKRAAAFAGAASFVAASRAAAQEKFSREDAEYQDEPKDGETCEYCALFIAPTSCRIIDGDISPKGWCKYWAGI